jgi:hypothetical protein
MTSALAAFTLFHVLLSLIGIATGFVVIFSWLRSETLERWTFVFLASTIATSLTGFLFPFVRFLPSHATGILSLLVLGLALVSRYAYHLNGWFRGLFTVSAVTAQYLNVFVLIVQLFLKVPPLTELAPTQSELPFLLAQGLSLVACIWLGIAVTRRSKNWPTSGTFSAERSASN